MSIHAAAVERQITLSRFAVNSQNSSRAALTVLTARN
jgi:hypothetical protein